jgi:hypothetical protein
MSVIVVIVPVFVIPAALVVFMVMRVVFMMFVVMCVMLMVFVRIMSVRIFFLSKVIHGSAQIYQGMNTADAVSAVPVEFELPALKAELPQFIPQLPRIDPEIDKSPQGHIA